MDLGSNNTKTILLSVVYIVLLVLLLVLVLVLVDTNLWSIGEFRTGTLFMFGSADARAEWEGVLT